MTDLERRISDQQLTEADDGRQHVVEIVGNAAGEPADRLQLLGLAQLLLEESLLGHVASDGEHDALAADLHGRVRKLHQDRRTVRARDLERRRRDRTAAVASSS